MRVDFQVHIIIKCNVSVLWLKPKPGPPQLVLLFFVSLEPNPVTYRQQPHLIYFRCQDLTFHAHEPVLIAYVFTRFTRWNVLNLCQ